MTHPARVARTPALLALALVGCSVSSGGGIPVLRVEPDAPLGAAASATGPSNLQRALEGVRGRLRLELAPGQYLLAPTAYTDPTCGNCEDASTPVPATLGVRLSGTGIEVTGPGANQVVIHTRAGYGILVEDCAGCVLRGITITGGVRDADGRATDAGVVVRRSTLRMEACRIADNIGDSATVAAVVVGVAGIAGREGADLSVTGCRIERNSWDGIALYRGARADIRDNVVDGVDKARGAQVGGGRGVGIGLTWDARATIEGNLVRRYWKGIGVFVDAQATVRRNVVEDILTWGLAYWGAGEGRPAGWFEDNVVYRTGACGALLDRSSGGEPSGSFLRNTLVRTAQDPRYDSGEPYCPQAPIARVNGPAGFAVADNLLFDNRQPGNATPEPQVDGGAMRARMQTLRASLGRSPALREAYFFAEMEP